MYKDPIEKFSAWYKDAESDKNIAYPSAAALATSTADGVPSVRMVLVKHFDSNGFVFCTNLNSKKAGDLYENNHASLLFYWPGRQVRIEGIAHQISNEEADRHFNERPLQSRIISILSKQSQILDDDFADKIRNYNEKKIKRPDYWAGFRIAPNKFEFWTEGEYRNHERIVYELKDDESYEAFKLYP